MNRKTDNGVKKAVAIIMLLLVCAAGIFGLSQAFAAQIPGMSTFIRIVLAAVIFIGALAFAAQLKIK